MQKFWPYRVPFEVPQGAKIKTFSKAPSGINLASNLLDFFCLSKFILSQEKKVNLNI